MRIYQHFAVITIVITLGVAVFAEGESRTATDAAGANRPAPVQHRPSKVIAKSTSSADIGNEQGSVGDFGADIAMGSPTDLAGQLTANSGIIPDYLPDDAISNAAIAAGYPAHVLAAMSTAEREALVKGLKDAGLMNPEAREVRAATLLSASRNRSGGSGEIG